MMFSRRKNYPRVKILGGLYSARREPKNDPIIREIKDAVNCMSIQRHAPSGEFTLVESSGIYKS